MIINIFSEVRKN